ncbi:MAG: alpha-L-fucosidase [Gammaproteobacteria bacterium]
MAGALPIQPGVFEDRLINFGRTTVAERLRLEQGPLRVQLRIPAVAGEVRIRSIELLPVEGAAIRDAAAVGQRASTDWLARAGYGVMFHWTSESQPRYGQALSYEQAVSAFEAVSFARMVEDTGAGYVIFTVNHAKPHCPAPIGAWARVHPGATTRRDLLADIAKALAERNVPLILYIASHTLGKLGESSDAQYFRIHEDILKEMGERYGHLVAGYWFDGWYQSLEAYPRIDLRKLIPHVRAGNPARIAAYNFWVYPIDTAWQDYWAGEVGGIVRPAEARYASSGPAIGLQSHFLLFADAPWVHSVPNAEMEPLRFSDRELIEFVKANARHQVPVTINLGIYQDGTIGDAARSQMAALRRAIRGE